MTPTTEAGRALHEELTASRRPTFVTDLILAIEAEAAAAERERWEDAGYLADAATHLLDHIRQTYPGFYCEDADNVRHFAAKVLALLADPDKVAATWTTSGADVTRVTTRSVAIEETEG